MSGTKTAEAELIYQLHVARNLALLWQDDRRRCVYERLGVTDPVALVGDAEYGRVMDAVAAVDAALAAVALLAKEARS